MFHPSRGGVRGGRDQFDWEDIKKDKDRFNYLGNSLKAVVKKPWNQGPEADWYVKDGVLTKEEKKNELLSEIETIKAQEKAMMDTVLTKGFGYKHEVKELACVPNEKGREDRPGRRPYSRETVRKDRPDRRTLVFGTVREADRRPFSRETERKDRSEPNSREKERKDMVERRAHIRETDRSDRRDRNSLSYRDRNDRDEVHRRDRRSESRRSRSQSRDRHRCRSPERSHSRRYQ